MTEEEARRTPPSSKPPSSSSSPTMPSLEDRDVADSDRKFSYASTVSSYIYCIFVLVALTGIALVVIDQKSRPQMGAREEVFNDRQSSFLIYKARFKNDINHNRDFRSESDEKNEIRRKLALKIDPITGDSVETYNGDVPETQCPVGKYRIPGSTDLQMIRGQRTDGCVYCPRGRYGETTRLSNRRCTAPCPMGRYGDRLGASSVQDCQYCPPGKIGETQALTTPRCSGSCPPGKYSGQVGLTSSSQCLDCPVGYRGWQCGSWDTIPLKDSQLDRLNAGNPVTNPDRILE